MSAHLAKEAERLQSDNIFNAALDAIRAEALDALAVVDADSYHAVVRQQQRVAVVDEIRATLGRYIVAAEIAEDTGSFA